MTTSSYPATPGTDGDREPSYEWKAVTLMSLGMGLVGVDRFLVVPLLTQDALGAGQRRPKSALMSELRVIAGGGELDIPALAEKFGVRSLGPAPSDQPVFNLCL